MFIILQSIFFMIGLLGFTLVWGIIGFIIIATYELELELKNKPVSYIIKTFICGPLFLIFCYIKRKNSKE